FICGLFALFASVESIAYPARSALFPYTTLFRSEPVGRLLGARGLVDLGGDDLRFEADAAEQLAPPRRRGGEHQRRGAVGAAAHPDRKSTRLNSSHVKISYAVFCLKNKIIRLLLG